MKLLIPFLSIMLITGNINAQESLTDFEKLALKITDKCFPGSVEQFSESDTDYVLWNEGNYILINRLLRDYQFYIDDILQGESNASHFTVKELKAAFRTIGCKNIKAAAENTWQTVAVHLTQKQLITYPHKT